MTIGLIDTGVNSDHPDLSGAILPGKEFPDLGTGAHDAHGHGTEMAVLIAGRGHGSPDGTVGVAPEAMILPVKVNGNNRDVTAAITWAVDQGAKVLNISLGSSVNGSPTRYDDGLRYAQERDVVIVAAAGNPGSDARVTTPANRPGVVAVSAVDETGTFRPDVSMAGPEVALAAPGVGITTLRDRGSTRAVGTSRGTSEAAAMVSGTAALIRARFPALNASDVIERLIRTAEDKGTPGRDVQYGFGVLSPVRALTSEITAKPYSNILGTLVNPTGDADEIPIPDEQKFSTFHAVALVMSITTVIAYAVLRRTRSKKVREEKA